MTRIERRVLLRRISRWSIGIMLTCSLVLGVLIAFSDERHPSWPKECNTVVVYHWISTGKGTGFFAPQPVTTCHYLPLTMGRAFERFARQR